MRDKDCSIEELDMLLASATSFGLIVEKFRKDGGDSQLDRNEMKSAWIHDARIRDICFVKI